MLAAIREIQALGAGRGVDELTRDNPAYKAILYNFVIIGEAARHVPDDVGERAPEIDWPGMRAMRNVVTHVYFGVNAASVHATIINDLPPTAAALERLLKLDDRTGDEHSAS